MDGRLYAYDLGASGVGFRQAAVACWRLTGSTLDDGKLCSYLRMDLERLENAQQALGLGKLVGAELSRLNSDCSWFEEAQNSPASFGIGPCPGAENWEKFLFTVDAELSSRPWLGPWFRLGRAFAEIIRSSLDEKPSCFHSEVARAQRAALDVIGSDHLPTSLAQKLHILITTYPGVGAGLNACTWWLYSVRELLHSGCPPDQGKCILSIPAASVPLITWNILEQFREALKAAPLPHALDVSDKNGFYSAILNGFPYPINVNQFWILRFLLDAKGAYLTEEKLHGMGGTPLSSVRIRREINRLPQPIRALICAKPGWHGGVRLDLTAKNNY